MLVLYKEDDEVFAGLRDAVVIVRRTVPYQGFIDVEMKDWSVHDAWFLTPNLGGVNVNTI